MHISLPTLRISQEIQGLRVRASDGAYPKVRSLDALRKRVCGERRGRLSLYSQPPPYLVHYLLESPTLVVLGNPGLSSPVKICFLCRKLRILRLAHSYPRRSQSDSQPWLTPFGSLSQLTRRCYPKHSVIPNRIHPSQGYNVSVRVGQQRLLFQGLVWKNAPSGSFSCLC